MLGVESPLLEGVNTELPGEVDRSLAFDTELSDEDIRLLIDALAGLAAEGVLLPALNGEIDGLIGEDTLSSASI